MFGYARMAAALDAIVGPAVLLPRHAIDAWRGLMLEGLEGDLQGLDADVVEQRGELLLLPLSCGFPHTLQRPG